MSKQLTIVVPSYNAEPYLEKCLNTFLSFDTVHAFEIIVVNDGSTDKTEEIATEYAKKYPKIIKLLNKTNGGHGSTINSAIKIAKGRYFKVVDADDWMVHFDKYLDCLAETDVDAIVTGYQTVDMHSGKKNDITSICEYNGKDITMKEFSTLYSKIGNCFSFHGLTFKTDKYRKHAITLSENVFYEDQEYACLPFSYVETIKVLPFFVYQHLIGNENQSIAVHNQVKRLGDMEVVIKKLFYFMQEKDLEDLREDYFLHILRRAVQVYFATSLVKNPNKKEGRTHAYQMYSYVKTMHSSFFQSIKKQYSMLLLLNKIHFPFSIIEKLQRTKLYRLIKTYTH